MVARSFLARFFGSVSGVVNLGVVLLAVVPVSAPLSAPLSAKDEVDYKPVVTIHKVNVITTEKGKKKTRTIEVEFDVDSNIPKKAKIEFELEYRVTAIAKTHYVLKDERRSGLKMSWAPKVRLPVDEYLLISRLPLDLQTKAVQKAMEKKEKAYPALSAPWSWYHTDRKVQVGTPEELAEEQKEITKVFMDWTGKLIELNNEMMDTCDAIDEGTKFVEDGKVDKTALGEFVTDWAKRLAAVQLEIDAFPQKDPGIWRKTQKSTFLTADLGRMVAKRCIKRRLTEVLQKYGLSLPDLKLPPVKGFDPNYRFGVSASALGAIYQKIATDAKFPEEEEEGEGEDKGDTDE